MPVYLERISSAQLRSLSREQTVFFFPLGGLEDRGPHLPLGFELAKSEQLSLLLAERMERELPGWVGVILPRAPLGMDPVRPKSSLKVRAHVLRDWLVDAGLPLSKMGFRHFVVVSAQKGPKQLTSIEEAGRLLRARAAGWLRRGFKSWLKLPVLVSAQSGAVSWSEVSRAPLKLDPLEHGGRADTSIALFACPDLVHPQFRQLAPEVPPRSGWKRRRINRQGQGPGYWGAPAEASAEEGARLLAEEVDTLMPKLRAVWSGSNPEAVFRSWYSIFPPNRSFFTAWMLASLVGLILVAWFILMLPQD